MPSLWNSLLDPNALISTKGGKPKEKTIGGISVGCEDCTLAPMGHHKFLDRSTTGRNQLWLQSPTMLENDVAQPGGGPGGLYGALTTLFHSHGVNILDFEIRFAVKCTPAVYKDGTKYELSRPREEHFTYCLQHTRNLAQINATSRAKSGDMPDGSVTILLGYDTGKQHSDTFFKADAPVYWHPELQTTCYVLPYPTPAMLKGQHHDSKRFYKLFRAACWHTKNPGRYSYLHSLDVRPIYTAAHFREVLAELRACGTRISTDIEDDGQGRLLCIGFCYDPKFAYCLVLDHPENPHWEQEKEELWELLGEYLGDAALEKIFQFGSYDAVELQDRYGFIVRGYTFDTLYGSYLYYSYNRKHGLEAIAQREFPVMGGYKTIVEQYYSKSEDEESGTLDRGIAGLAQCPLPILTQYNGGDVILTKRAEIIYAAKVHLPLMDCYIRAGITLRRAEDNGPVLDKDHQQLVLRIVQKDLEDILARLKTLTNSKEFNPDSSPQLKYYMFEHFNLPRLGEIDEDLLDEDNYDATDATALERIALDTEHEFPKLILEWRKKKKFLQYATKFEESASYHEGEVRTRFMLAGAATGRLRAAGEKDKVTKRTRKLNLQNIPRAAFIKNMLCSDPLWRSVLQWAARLWSLLAEAPGPGTKDADGNDLFAAFLKAHWADLKNSIPKVPEWILELSIWIISDLSAAEVRLMAFYSRDESMISAFREGLDIHSSVGVGMRMGEYNVIKKDKDLRAKVKAVVFGLLFGLTPTGLYYYVKKTVPNATREEVSMMHERFFERFTGVGDFINKCHHEYKTTGGVGTPWGFWREINNRVVHASLDNTSVNCVDYDSYILTKRGWLSGRDLTTNDECMTEVGWQKPLRVSRFDGPQPTYTWESKNRWQWVSTAEHRWDTIHQDHAGRKTEKVSITSEIPSHGEIKVRRTLKEITVRESFTDQEVRIAGWFVTDGYMSRTPIKGRKGAIGKRAQIMQSKPDMVARIRELVKGVGVRENYNKITGQHSWHFSGSANLWLVTTFPERVLTSQFIESLSRRQARLLVEEMQLGDGDRLCCGTEEKATMFEMLCAWAGYATSRSTRMPKPNKLVKAKQPVYIVRVLRRETMQILHSQARESVAKDGVWCPTFPIDKPWVMMRKGTTTITRNTPIQGGAHQFLLICLAILQRQPRKYHLLAPSGKKGLSLEIHDALYGKTTLRNVWTAKTQIVHLMEVADLQYSRDFFGVDFDLPMICEPSFGYTMGTEAGFDAFKEEPDPKDLLLTWLVKFWETEYADARKYNYDNRLVDLAA